METQTEFYSSKGHVVAVFQSISAATFTKQLNIKTIKFWRLKLNKHINHTIIIRICIHGSILRHSLMLRLLNVFS